ncbi:hypothetical protein ACFXPA_48265 [Amycolatopsis sp. NPDC059090]|uniref:hypothetical protein n=1 Tax=unclassified Amycolatopsis TaxID=2618356 RepID=UPI00367194FB
MTGFTAAAVVTALALIAQVGIGEAVSATTPPAPRAAQVRLADPPGTDPAAERTTRQFDVWSKQSPEEWNESLEEGCIEHGGTACEMTGPQARALQNDIRTLTKQMHDEILANPAEVAELKQDRKQQQESRGIGSGFGKLVKTVAKFASNPAVRRLADKADDIGEIAGHVTNATYAQAGLSESTEVAVAKSVISMTPVIGDIFSLGESIANGDIEGGAVAVVSLIGTAVSVAFPPAGAVVAVALAAYYLAKMFIGWFSAKPRDWIADPPGTPQELFESGADLKWETHKVAGKDVAIAFPPPNGQAKTVKQTLLLDSKWTDTNRDRQPVNYTISGKTLVVEVPVHFTDVSMGVWQNGRRTATSSKCMIAPGKTVYLTCEMDKATLIGLNRPAVLQVAYSYDKRNERSCAAKPCAVHEGKSFNAYLRVRFERYEAGAAEASLQRRLPVSTPG